MIIGRLIPAGTGTEENRNILVKEDKAIDSNMSLEESVDMSVEKKIEV